jgi:hypothetical protein
MGACCGSSPNILVRHEGKEQRFDHIIDINVLRTRITDHFKISDFDLYIDGRPISTNEEFRRHLNSRTLVEIDSIKKIKPIEKPPVKIVDPISLKVPSQYENCVNEIVDKSGERLTTNVALSSSYVIIHEKYLPEKPNSVYLKSNPQNKKMKFFRENEPFIIYKLQGEEVESIEKKNIGKLVKKATIASNNKVDITQAEQVSEYKSPKDLNDNYLGFPVFHKNFLIGFVSKISGKNVTLVDPGTILPEIKNSPKSSLEPIKVKINSIDFENSPKPVESEIEEVIINSKERDFQDKEIDSVSEMTIDMSPGSPDQYSYYLSLPNRLYSYRSTNLFTNWVNLRGNFQEGGSFTSSPIGLYYIGQKAAKIINEGKIEDLTDLKNSHLFHSAVWHQDTLYVIGGVDTTSVEYLENDSWTPGPELLFSVQNSAVCSTGNFIYLMGGRNAYGLTNSVLKLDKIWEELSWKSPWKLEGMGLIYSKDCFILFGGCGKSLKNNKYCEIDLNGKENSRAELPATGFFARKAFGKVEDTYSFLVSEHTALEYSFCFKLVSL